MKLLKSLFLACLVLGFQQSNADQVCQDDYRQQIEILKIQNEGLLWQYKELTGKTFGEEDEESTSGSRTASLICLIGGGLTAISGPAVPLAICAGSLGIGALTDNAVDADANKTNNQANRNKQQALQSLIERINLKDLQIAEINGAYSLLFTSDYQIVFLVRAMYQEKYGRTLEAFDLQEAFGQMAKDQGANLCKNKKLLGVSDLMKILPAQYDKYELNLAIQKNREQEAPRAKSLEGPKVPANGQVYTPISERGL